MTRETPNEALRSILREGDPAADGREPDAEEAARLRARVLDAAGEALLDPPCLPDTGWRWTPAAVAVAALLAVVALGAVTLQLSRSAAPGSAKEGRDAAGGVHDPAHDPDPHLDRSPRQIQFTTPGGTRVVWMLYPESTDSDRRAARPGGRS